MNRLQPAASTPNEKILRAGIDAYNRLEPVEFVDDGEEIFVACEQRARGKLSGVEISQQLFSVYRFRDSKVVELRVYADRAPALDSMHG